MIEGFLTPMNKEEYKVWEDWIMEYNHNNPKDPIAYEVKWNEDNYKVKLLNSRVDTEGKQQYHRYLFQVCPKVQPSTNLPEPKDIRFNRASYWSCANKTRLSFKSFTRCPSYCKNFRGGNTY